MVFWPAFFFFVQKKKKKAKCEASLGENINVTAELCQLEDH